MNFHAYDYDLGFLIDILFIRSDFEVNIRKINQKQITSTCTNTSFYD